MRSRVFFVLAALLAIGALACSAPGTTGAAKPAASGGGGLDKLIADAKAEGTLTWYSGDGEDLLKLQAASFEKKYGIKVNILRLNVDELEQRLAGEQTTGVKAADVLTLADPEIFAASAEWFRPLNDDLIPDWSKYPEKARSKNYALLRESPAVIQYNTDLVPKEKVPTKWEDMLDPFWKGKILLTDPRSSPTYMGWAKYIKGKYGIEFLQKLKGQEFTLAQSGGPGAQNVAAGAAFANFPARTVHSTALRQKKAPIAYVAMGGPTGAPIETGILASAPHPNAARLFVHYELSVESQKEVCKSNEVASFYPNDSMPECLPLAADWQLPDYKVTDQEKKELLSALGIG